MKKLFLSLLLCASFGFFEAAYVPATGPLTLGDPGVYNGNRGAIMQAVINHNNDPKLVAANQALAAFDGQGQAFRPYQAIMSNIAQSTNTQAALDAAKAIETVIMHLYGYDTYALGSYKPGTSVFMTGIRYANIFSDDAKTKQLIDELDKLANIVSLHSTIMSARLKVTVHSYRHWRRNLALSCAAYLAGDAIKHGMKDSILNQFYQGGLSNSGEIALNHLMNAVSSIWYVGKGIGKGAQGVWDYGIKPGGKFILGGVEAFRQKEAKADAQLLKKKLEITVNKPNDNAVAAQPAKVTTQEQGVQVPEIVPPAVLPVSNAISQSLSELENKQEMSEREKYKAVIGEINNAVMSVVTLKYKDELMQRQKELSLKVKDSVVTEFGNLKRQFGKSFSNVQEDVQDYIKVAQEHRKIKQETLSNWFGGVFLQVTNVVNKSLADLKAFPGAVVKYIKDCDTPENN